LYLCFQHLGVLSMVYWLVQASWTQASGAWNTLHRFAGDLHFYIHRRIGRPLAIVDDLIGTDVGVDIRTTLQLIHSEFQKDYRGLLYCLGSDSW